MEKVNHPEHYNNHPSGIECIEIAKHHDFCIGNAIKYIWRAGLKYDEHYISMEEITKAKIEDLRKAIWYLEEEIKLIEGKKEKFETAASCVPDFSKYNYKGISEKIAKINNKN